MWTIVASIWGVSLVITAIFFVASMRAGRSAR